MKVIIGAIRNRTRVGARGNDGLLEHQLQAVGEGLQQAERADHVGPAAQLDRRPTPCGRHRSDRPPPPAAAPTTARHLEQDDDGLAQPVGGEETGQGRPVMPSLRRHQLGARAVHSAMVFGRAADRTGHVEIGDRRGGTARRLCPPCRSAPSAPRCCWIERAAKLRFTATSRGRTWPSVSYGSVCPGASDRARRIAQSSRASPGG